MNLPSADTPLYNHSLSMIEAWLRSRNCQQDRLNLSSWHVKHHDWEAEISMDVEEIRVRYINVIAGNKDLYRSFPIL